VNKNMSSKQISSETSKVTLNEPIKFVARVRRRAKILEITIPRKIARTNKIDHGTLIEVQINKIVYS
jgi:hypothetical protein